MPRTIQRPQIGINRQTHNISDSATSEVCFLTSVGLISFDIGVNFPTCLIFMYKKYLRNKLEDINCVLRYASPQPAFT